MFKRIALAALLLITASIAAANAQGFLLGTVVGGALFGGSNQYGGGGTAILYTADEEVLKKTDPLTVRQVASRGCFNSAYERDNSKYTLGEIFALLTKERGQKERTILQIARVFDPSTTMCASIWFAYTEK